MMAYIVVGLAGLVVGLLAGFLFGTVLCVVVLGIDEGPLDPNDLYPRLSSRRGRENCGNEPKDGRLNAVR